MCNPCNAMLQPRRANGAVVRTISPLSGEPFTHPLRSRSRDRTSAGMCRECNDSMTTAHRLWVLLAAALSVCGCATAPAAGPAADGGGEQSAIGATELAVAEAMFRHLIAANASGGGRDARAYFLSIEDRDPPDELLARFAAQRPPVRPGSQFTPGEGLLLEVRGIRQLDATSAEAIGEYYEANLSAGGGTYRLRRRAETWVVVAGGIEWLSALRPPPGSGAVKASG
jgi:hypothetical protein